MSESSAPLERSPRRTQAERRAETRERLQDATIDCLVERGYQGTTTAEIETRAGVSRGARLHHYPTKAELVAAAVERLHARLGGRYARAMESMGPDARHFATGYALLWETYSDPAQSAVLELMVAARTDPELRRALRDVMARQHREALHRANGWFPDLATREAEGLLESLQATMLGLALRRTVFGEIPQEKRVLDLVERLVQHHFLESTDE